MSRETCLYVFSLFWGNVWCLVNVCWWEFLSCWRVHYEEHNNIMLWNAVPFLGYVCNWGDRMLICSRNIMFWSWIWTPEASIYLRPPWLDCSDFPFQVCCSLSFQKFRRYWVFFFPVTLLYLYFCVLGHFFYAPWKNPIAIWKRP